MKIKFTVEANIENGKLSNVNISNVTNLNGYVDLGLPSGTLWAKCNYGANSETESGCCFTWDEAKKLPITLPTKEQFEELLKYTKHDNVWYFDEGGNIGIGIKLTSKIDETKHIFIPTNGRDHDGSVWSSSSYPYSNYAWYLYFNINSDKVGVYGNNTRYNSYSVRGVINI